MILVLSLSLKELVLRSCVVVVLMLLRGGRRRIYTSREGVGDLALA